jgi:hypothetical protein
MLHVAFHVICAIIKENSGRKAMHKNGVFKEKMGDYYFEHN